MIILHYILRSEENPYLTVEQMKKQKTSLRLILNIKTKYIFGKVHNKMCIYISIHHRPVRVTVHGAGMFIV